YMPCRSSSAEIMQGYQLALRVHQGVRSAVLRGEPGGARELQLAQKAIKSAHALYGALKAGLPLEATPPILEGVNSLQCLFSHGTLYSNRRDFAFAKHVFENTPNYRDIQRTSLIEGTILVPETPSQA